NAFDDCKDYVEFRDKVGGQSATMVFSSYYLGNPSSVFGHTLLRINKGDPGPSHAALLDYGVNYAPVADMSNAVTYAWNGMFGGFHGVFTNLRYYYKVREYNDFESRDLWEYDLNLTPEEMAQLTRHLWELGFSDFPYYYLTKNCSYHLLAALEAAAPRL